MANNFINLEEIIENWAWKQYDRTSTTRRQRKLRQKDNKERGRFLTLDIDWSESRFTDTTLWNSLRAEPDNTDGRNTAGDAATVAETNVNKHDQPSRSAPRASVLFQTKFTNNTAKPQEYTMKTEKKTKTTLTTTMEQGYTRGVEMSIKLAAPAEIFEANAGYSREFSLTRSDGETFEEELTWGVESLIHVDPGHVAEASLVVDERKEEGTFTIVSHIRGQVQVTFTAPSDNNSFVKSISNDIVYIIKEHIDKAKARSEKINFIGVEVINGIDTVVVETKGKCRFRYGVKQEIRLDQKPLNSHK